MAAKKSVKKAAVNGAAKKVSTAAFIRECIKSKKFKDDKAILAAARKRAPKQKIGDNYVSWYRTQMKSDRAPARA